MANMKNAEKRVLVNEKKNSRNNTYLASAKTATKNAHKAILGKDKATAEEALRVAIKRIDKSAGAGVMAKNKCARQKSRLTKKVNQMK